MNAPVLLDTNSLIYSIKNKVDLQKLSSVLPGTGQVFVPECVLSELRGLSEDNRYAKAALILAERFYSVRSTGTGDDCIVDVATELGAVVLTNDRGLIERLKKSGVRALSIRGGKTIDFV